MNPDLRSKKNQRSPSPSRIQTKPTTLRFIQLVLQLVLKSKEPMACALSPNRHQLLDEAGRTSLEQRTAPVPLRMDMDGAGFPAGTSQVQPIFRKPKWEAWIFGIGDRVSKSESKQVLSIWISTDYSSWYATSGFWSSGYDTWRCRRIYNVNPGLIDLCLIGEVQVS